MVLITEFLRQVKENPDDIAVSIDDKQITYRELNRYSDFIAAYILKYKFSKGHISLLFEQGADMITCTLAVLKAGLTYIPLSNQYPRSRLKYILEDSESEVLITTNNNMHLANKAVSNLNRKINIINIDDIDIETENIQINTPYHNEYAYILYTSGSTGTPKGVIQTQSNIMHFTRQYANRLNIGKETKMTLFSYFCHDAAVIDIFSGLLHGATLYPKDIRAENGFDRLSSWLIKEEINIWHSVPTLYRYFAAYLSGLDKRIEFKDLKHIVLGGENVIQQDVNEFKRLFDKSVLVNLYGQSESSYNSSQFICSNSIDTRINIGESIDDTEIFVVDEFDQEVMPLEVGEIVISSPYVALGYWNKQELTREAFSYDEEFISEYRTGDLGRLEANGSITWLGRKDQQVKVRGYRIELGEIEASLIENKRIKDAAAIIKETENSDVKLLLYYTTTETISKIDIQRYLSDRLPSYMIPNAFIEIEEMPLTVSGKVDRGALKKIDAKLTKEIGEKNKLLPRNFVENTLAFIWKEVLDINTVYIEDDFFELGGNSINIIQICSRIKEELEVEVSIADLVVNKSILELSEHISTMSDDYSEGFNHVYKINKSESNKNIFIVHGGDGDIYYFRHLAKSLEDQYNVYGIQPSGLNGKEPLPNSAFEMIKAYTDEIRRIQSEGPYIFAGYCIGSYFAYDITKLFEIQGDEVGALLELDSYAFIRKEHKKKMFIYNKLLKAIELWRRICRKNKGYTMDKFSKTIPRAKPTSIERQLEIIKDRKKLLKFFGTQLLYDSHYGFLGYISSPTLVIKAKENDHELLREDLWLNMVRGLVEFKETSGNHNTILIPPNAHKVAAIIKNFLKNIGL